MSNASAPNGVRNIDVGGNGKYVEGYDSSIQATHNSPANYYISHNNGDTTRTSQNHQGTLHTSRASENTQSQPPPRDPPYSSLSSQRAPPMAAEPPGDTDDAEADRHRLRQYRPQAASSPATPGSGLNGNPPNLEAEIRRLSPEMQEYLRNLRRQAHSNSPDPETTTLDDET